MKSKTGRTYSQNFMLERHIQNPRCYICGKVTVFDPRKNAKLNATRQKPPDEMATIDHIYPKTDIRRLLVGDKAFTELCCYKCNHERSLEDNSRMGYIHIDVNLISIFNTGIVYQCVRPNALCKLWP